MLTWKVLSLYCKSSHFFGSEHFIFVQSIQLTIIPKSQFNRPSSKKQITIYNKRQLHSSSFIEKKWENQDSRVGIVKKKGASAFFLSRHRFWWCSLQSDCFQIWQIAQSQGKSFLSAVLLSSNEQMHEISLDSAIS